MNSNRIKELAKEKNISIRELAKKIGITEAGLHKALAANSTKVETLEKIADALGVSITEFFDSSKIETNNLKQDLININDLKIFIRTLVENIGKLQFHHILLHTGLNLWLDRYKIYKDEKSLKELEMSKNQYIEAITNCLIDIEKKLFSGNPEIEKIYEDLFQKIKMKPNS